MEQSPTPVPRTKSQSLGTLLFVWGGAFSFLASLAYGVTFYLGPLGRTIPMRSWADEAEAVATNIVLFTLFAAHHSLMARARAKVWLTRVVPSHLERTTYVWVASLLFLLVCWLWRPVGGELYRLEGALAWGAVGVQVTGVLLTGAGVHVLNWSELAGVQAARTSGELVFSRGVYGFVRHPLYLGWMLMTCGTPHLTGGRLVFAAVSALYLLLAIPWEERSLVAEHGESYERYRARIRWRVMPGIY